MWPLAAYGVGLVVGPLGYAALQFGLALGSRPTAVRIACVVAAGLAVVAGWAWFTALTRTFLRVPARRALLLAVPVLGTGSTLWVLLALTGSPFVGFTGLIADWLLLTVPYALAAAAARPAGGAGWRAASVAALVALAAVWVPAGGVLARHREAAARAALGLPASMYRVIDLPGYSAGPYTAYRGALILGYDGPDGSPIGPGDDLVLTVVRARTATTPCVDGRPGPGDAALGTGCRAADGSRWWFTDAAGDTTLVETDHGMFVGLTVDSLSDAPVAPSRLPGLFATLHAPGTAELSAVAAGNG